MTDPEFDSLMPLCPLYGEEPLSSQETAMLQNKLWAILHNQVKLKTQGDHTSLREEDAAELLDSIVFTLQYHLKCHKLPLRALLSCDLPNLYKEAQSSLYDCYTQSEALYRIAMRNVDTFGNQALMDTLAGIGIFFQQYDYRMYAQHIPASIDYQLCFSVPENMRGTIYIYTYLQHLLIENELLCRFSKPRVIALLNRASPDYKELLIGLYEPVAAVVLGHSCLGGGETLLDLSASQANIIVAQITALPPAQAKAALRIAAQRACSRLQIHSAQYLGDFAETLYPRLLCSQAHASHVFYARTSL